MSIPIFLLSLLSTLTAGQPPPPLRGYLINCGSKNDLVQDGIKYTKDDSYTVTGTLKTLNRTDILSVLTTLRYFPYGKNGKHCYTFPVTNGAKFLIRTTYFYGGFDGGTEPPIFDQIIDGTTWSTVNTTEDYRNGLSSYYEIIVTANDKTVSVCFACNEHTKSGSNPFINSLEVLDLDSSLYNSTDFGKYGLVTVARSIFAFDGDIVRFPDDPFNRYWQPFVDGNPAVEAHANVTSSEFWNRPPAKVFLSGATTSRGKNLTLQWPPFSLPTNRYYVALYFQDSRSTSPYSWRVFTVLINSETFYQDLNVTTKGVTVYGTEWPLSGDTQITLTPRSDMPVGPTINAGEIYQILPLAGTTLGRDVMALQMLRQSIRNPPDDWNGDPCLPKEHPWLGIGCSEGKEIRVTSLNLKGLSLIGTLPKEIAGLTALKEIRLSMNKLTGPIPDLSPLKSLEILHLDENEFEGPFPDALGTLPNLRELLLNKNRLSGGPPQNLIERKGMILRT
ncbi:putative transferase [Helianthus annuus]|uniref:Putative leucine-rich repeat (LRR) family protein n=1 Tax=Helianthus annuus TaxID=4232 RepID=A0A251TW43_HELAN|nr:receptor-like protein kinase At3g21340 [Helianthus annuus]KAF5759221.1 putative transferase [Helianthus annuus]KAJ0437458.1 putative transferase [Helianthus annuus]KAJ0459776.1 putative transferase [Helianthus annuus]